MRTQKGGKRLKEKREQRRREGDRDPERGGQRLGVGRDRVDGISKRKRYKKIESEKGRERLERSQSRNRFLP